MAVPLQGRRKGNPAPWKTSSLLGVGGSHMSEEKASGAFGGAKGLANMQRLARSIEERPSQWSDSFDTSVWRALSCDVTGAPWSLQRYGQERLKWG
eukprot:737606-Amphidinium_carterae.2